MFAPAIRLGSHGIRDSAEITLIWSAKNFNRIKNKECGMRCCHTVLKGALSPKVYTNFGKYRVHLSCINYSTNVNSSLLNTLDTVGKRSTDVEEFLAKHSVTVTGNNPEAPFLTIESAGFSNDILSVLRNCNINEPTPIQSLAWAHALQGRDFIGISKTGSGKTYAFIIPAIIHIRNLKRQEDKKSYRDSPLALVLVPTRELALQVERVAEMFVDRSLRCASLYGGASRTLQFKQIEKGVDLCIATPGRLLDFMNAGVLSLRKCSFLVLDEADRMLDMGFLPDMKEIINAIECKRQTLMWSATWPKEVESIARQFLSDCVRTVVGNTELEPNANIHQIVKVVDGKEKKERLADLLTDLVRAEQNPKILVFVETKFGVDTLSFFLKNNRIRVSSIHSGKSQHARENILISFREGRSTVLIATAVAARGLDIDNITHVINYDCPRTVEEYIHKIGRTARHEKTGTAYTFVTPEESHSKYLLDILEKSNEEIPEEFRSIFGNQFIRINKTYGKKVERFRERKFFSRT